MRMLLLALAIFHVANGVIMLAAPELWYANVPGVTETGPANVHFIRDIGLAFIAAGTALFMGVRSQHFAALLVPAAIFLSGHAGLHAVEMVVHGTEKGEAIRDIATIVLPGLLPLYAIAQMRLKTRRA